MKNSRNTILIFFLVLFGSNTMITQVKTGEYISLVFVSVLVFLNIVHNRLRGDSFLIRKRSYIAAALLVTNILLTTLVNFYIENGDFLLIIKIILAVVFVSSMPFEVFKKAYTQALIILAVYSLICTYLITYSPLISLFPTFKNLTGYLFYDFGACSVMATNNYFRNFGAFSEPGVYVCYLIPALVFCITDKNRSTKSGIAKIVILALTLVTTFSTVGVIAAAVLIAVFLFTADEIKKKKRILFFALLVVFGICLFSIPQFRESFNASLTKMTDKETSYVGRTYSIKRNLEGWLANPFFGLGLHNMTEVFKIEELERIATANTSTTTLFMATYGSFFAFLHLSGLYFTFNKKPELAGTISFAVFLFSINSQALFHSEILWYLTFYGFAQGGFGKNENLHFIPGNKKS